MQINAPFSPPQFQARPGIKTPLHPEEPIDCFQAYFPTDIFRLMAEETNNYALQFFDTPTIDELSENSRFRGWSDTDEYEMRKFLALEIGMGLCSKNIIQDYWETYWLTKTLSYGQIMSRDRYLLLRSFLHFNNNANQPNKGDIDYDPLYKFRSLVDLVQDTYMDMYQPHKELSVDEIMKRFKGRLNNSDVDYEPMESDNETIDSYESDDVDLSEHEDHKGWVEDYKFMTYFAHPDENDDQEVVDEWKEMTEYIREDLDWLLELPHHRFWSQMKFDIGPHQLLVSFLNHAPRYFDIKLPEDPEIKKIIDIIHHKSIFSDNFISPDTFGDAVYDGFIFDIPKMMDLCALYGLDNSKLLQKMISNIFSAQGSYFKDLHEASEAILNVLDRTSDKLGLHENNKPQSEVMKQMTLVELEDVSLFIVDTCASLFHFLEIFPKGYECFNQDIYKPRIVYFYENAVLSLVQELHSRMTTEDSSRIPRILKRLSLARSHLIRIYHQLLYTSRIQPLYDSMHANEKGSLADNLLDDFTSLLSDRRFLLDYDEKFPICDNLELIKQHNSNLDQTRIDYIANGIQMIQMDKKPEDVNLLQKFNNLSVKNESYDNMQKISESSDSENSLEGATACPAINGVELDSLITQVKDLLPDLGDGFVEACLDYYNYNPETVINCLLENNLPPVLQQLDRNEKCTPKPEVIAPEPSEPSVLESRANVFDDDEFDVFSKTQVDLSRIHIGKKNNYQKNFLDNKKDLKTVNEIYQRYTNVNAAGDEDDQFISLEYDDEYDDTYDSHLVGSTEPDADLDNERPFTTPRILQQAANSKVKYEIMNVSEEDEDVTPRSTNIKNYNNFVQDPAVLREIAEQKRQTYMQNRGRGGNHGARGGSRGRGKSNVEGKPKGQSQDADVLKNRNLKDKNKSMRANHNRRTLAQKKQGRGMF
ncbi:Activating signal cointegrator 1 complex subunit 2 [Nymphon striatum]|nr:Activating signal cointegrator 1 complex subunit 2 [Nymphon striatum]